MADEKNLPAQKKPFELMALSAHDMFSKVAGEEVWLKEIGFAMQIMRGSSYLQDVAKTQAGADSIKNAIVNVALCGTTLNPARKQAYLVPRRINNVMMCCLDMSYIGLAGIAMNSGSVKHIAARLVYTFDTFSYTEDNGQMDIQYKQCMDPPPEFTAGPGKFWDYLVCGYVIATLHDGTKMVTQPLLKWKLEKAMKTSTTNGEKTPWRTHPDEQCMKTLIKHASKLLPQTDRMSQAVDVLNQHEGIDTKGTNRQAGGTLGRFADAMDAETYANEDVDPESGMTPSEEAAERRRELEEHGTDEEKRQSGLFE